MFYNPTACNCYTNEPLLLIGIALGVTEIIILKQTIILCETIASLSTVGACSVISGKAEAFIFSYLSILEPFRQNLEIVSLFLYYFVFYLTGDDSNNKFVIIPLIRNALTTNHNRQ